MNDPNPAPSRYEQIGGHEGLLQLLRPFYIDIRQYDILGPIFNSHIEDWESHLQKITEFSALQTGGPATYRGGFAGAHMRLGLKPEFFDHWLGLWDFNCSRHLDQELAKQMSTLAHDMGRRLKNMLAEFRSKSFFPSLGIIIIGLGLLLLPNEVVSADSVSDFAVRLKQNLPAGWSVSTDNRAIHVTRDGKIVLVGRYSRPLVS
jgi:hemoglobin